MCAFVACVCALSDCGHPHLLEQLLLAVDGGGVVEVRLEVVRDRREDEQPAVDHLLQPSERVLVRDRQPLAQRAMARVGDGAAKTRLVATGWCKRLQNDV